MMPSWAARPIQRGASTPALLKAAVGLEADIKRLTAAGTHAATGLEAAKAAVAKEDERRRAGEACEIIARLTKHAPRSTKG